MANIDLPTLKQWGMEIGVGIWGTVQGTFNERQTTTQIIVDAAIGMIPLVGDVTAARDLLAVSIHLIPRARTPYSGDGMGTAGHSDFRPDSGDGWRNQGRGPPGHEGGPGRC